MPHANALQLGTRALTELIEIEVIELIESGGEPLHGYGVEEVAALSIFHG